MEAKNRCRSGSWRITSFMASPFPAFAPAMVAADSSGSPAPAGVWGGMPVARNARWRYDDRAGAERLTAPAAGVKARPCAEPGAWADGGGLIGFKDFAVNLIGVT